MDCCISSSSAPSANTWDLYVSHSRAWWKENATICLGESWLVQELRRAKLPTQIRSSPCKNTSKKFVGSEWELQINVGAEELSNLYVQSSIELSTLSKPAVNNMIRDGWYVMTRAMLTLHRSMTLPEGADTVQWLDDAALSRFLLSCLHAWRIRLLLFK